MLLTVHVLAAAALAGRSPNIFLAFLLGLITGIFLDLIPHYAIIPHKKSLLVENKGKAIKTIIFFLDLIVALMLAYILVANANQFVITDVFHEANSSVVFAAVIGVLIVPILELPYLLFGKLNISKKVFDLKKVLSLSDKGWSGYIVQIAVIILSVMLLTQIIHTPFGPL